MSITAPPGTRTLLTNSALDSLASATYASAGVIDMSAVDPIGAAVEVGVTPGTVSGDKGIYVFAQVSFDGTNYSTGPVSGTTTTDEPNLYLLGFLPCNTNATFQSRSFSLAAILGDIIPPYVKIIVKNATGAALAASGHAVYYTTYTGASAA